MKIILVILSIVLPLAMFYLQKSRTKLRNVYNFLAIIALLIFGNIASLSIYKIIKDGTVFMTAIHGIFLNPIFLITGAYLGIYVLYRLLLLSIVEQAKHKKELHQSDN